MRILECNIQNFGAISNQSFSFNSGCNVIYQENGWGKSTLAAFIKVMFYGFDNERSRDEINNERKKYKPWQGGVYGGTIKFSLGKKEYTLTRVFGTKEKDDEFSLRDATSNLESSDFTSNIGEEIFKIDSNSFARSVFIAQDDCETQTTDSINAKLGNLAEATDDINNYENVDKRLNDILNSMSSTRKTGSLYKLKEEIKGLELRAKKGQELDGSIRELERKKQEQKSIYQDLKVKKEELRVKQEKLNAYKDVQVKREKLAILTDSYKERTAVFEKEKEFFPGGIPDLESVDKHILLCNQMEAEKKNLALNQVEEKERERYSNLLMASKDEDLLGDKVLEDIDEQISKWVRRTEKKELLSSKKASYHTLRSMVEEREEKEEKPKKPVKKVELILGIVFLIFGIVLLFINKIAGCVVIAAGFILMVLGIVKIVLKRERNTLEQNDEIDSKKETNERITRLRDEIENDERYISYIEKDTEEFFNTYGITYFEKNADVSLSQLRTKVYEYRIMRDKEEKYNIMLASYEEKKKDTENFITGLGFKADNDLNSQLQAVKNHLHSYSDSLRELNKAKSEKEDYEKNNPDILSDFIDNTLIGEYSMTQLGEMINEISTGMENAHKNVVEYERQIIELQDTRDDIYLDEERLVSLTEEERVSKLLYSRLGKTKKYLEEAKLSFTAKYMKPIMQGFEKYYALLTKNEAEYYHIDAATNITVDIHGMQRSSRQLSTGYKDLLGVCIRMALVDAMYNEERPFVVFDDPFVNLDDCKVAGGLKLLEDISKEYQVIYFTCHKSRSI